VLSLRPPAASLAGAHWLGEGERPGRPRGSVVAMFTGPMAPPEHWGRSAYLVVPAGGRPVISRRRGDQPLEVRLWIALERPTSLLAWAEKRNLSAEEARRAPIERARPTHGPSCLMDLRRSEGSERSLAGAQRTDAVAGVVALVPRLRGICGRGGSGRGDAGPPSRALFVPVTQWRG